MPSGSWRFAHLLRLTPCGSAARIPRAGDPFAVRRRSCPRSGSSWLLSAAVRRRNHRKAPDELHHLVRGDGVLRVGRRVPADRGRVELRCDRGQRTARLSVVDARDVDRDRRHAGGVRLCRGWNRGLRYDRSAEGWVQAAGRRQVGAVRPRRQCVGVGTGLGCNDIFHAMHRLRAACATQTFRVHRGGAFRNTEASSRAAMRGWDPASYRASDVGARCARP